MARDYAASSGKPPRVLPTETYFQLVRENLRENGWAYVGVTGCSMWPLMHHLRDGVILVPPGKIASGDIVLFDRRNGRYALHRVIRAGKDGFSMMGDHQWHIEKKLPYDQIVGVVSEICRNGRRIPCTAFSMKAYALAMRFTAKPRVYIHTAYICIKKLLFHR